MLPTITTPTPPSAQTSFTPALVSQADIMSSSASTSSLEGRLTSEVVTASTSSVFEPSESLSVFKPLPTQLGVTTSEFETTSGSYFSTDRAAATTTIPVYVWPIAIIALVAVIVAIILAIVIFWKTKRSKYVNYLDYVKNRY